MNQREFAEKLRAGKITNYAKYLKGNKIGYSGFREELARQGLCLDKLAKSHEPGVQRILIENGYAKEQYETWAREGDPEVMQTLAQYGYCLDILSESTNEKVQSMLIYTKEAKHKWLEWAKAGTYKVRRALLECEECAEILANDPVDEIRAAAVLYYPQYVNCLIGKPGIETFIAIQKVLVERRFPEQEAYDYYMENIERFELDYKQEIKDTDEEVIKRYRKLNKILAEKYEAMKLPVTTLASTMTWAQLREAGNPFGVLARTGYFPEKFLRDRSKLVRAAVLKKHPEYAFQLLSYTNFEFRAAEEIIRRMPHLTREQLETFLKALGHEDTNEMTEYYQLKLASVKTKPSVLEVTMSAKDLHKLGNPLWVKDLSAHQIKLYDTTIRQFLSPDTMDIFYDAFDDLATADDLWDCHQIINRHTLRVK